MDEKIRAKAVEDFTQLQKQFPQFAAAFIAQQLVLIETAEKGNALVRDRMHELLEVGFIFPFVEFWEQAHLSAGAKALICMLRHPNRDPRDCLPSLTDWFDDPLRAGREVPPLPPERVGPRA